MQLKTNNMAYLEFNKEELVNLEYSLEREILLTNRAGGYINTTIVGCNTRKYHGLLVVPIENFANERHILLSTLHESLVQHGSVFNLGISSYGKVHEPRGHKYIVDFEMDYASTILYRVGGMVFSKTIMFVRETEEVLIKYTLIDAHSDTVLRLKPFLAFRNIHALTRANSVANTKYENVENGVSFKMYPGFPTLYLQTSKKGEWVANPDWYYNITYKEESRRGFADKEDLFVPGYFEMPIKKGESIILSASTSAVKARGLKALFTKEVAARDDDSRNSYEDCLKLAAQQCVIKQKGKYSVCAGYTWDYEDLRYSLIAIPGLTLFNDGNVKHFEAVIEDMLTQKRAKFFCGDGANEPDLPLWLFRTLQLYGDYGADGACLWAKYGKDLTAMLDSYTDGSRDDVVLHENGLLWSQKEGVALSWMNVYSDGEPVTERHGYQVETNALWYNALCFAVEMDEKYGNGTLKYKWGRVIESIKANYYNYFWIAERRHLADYFDENGRNCFARPNQLFAVGLKYSPIEDHVKMEVLKCVERELLTVRGIRTLSPKNPLYKGVYEGDQCSRDMAHHNGCVFPWLLGIYVESIINLIGKSQHKKCKELLNAFEEDINVHGIGSVAELYDGNPPHRPHGCISSSVSVAEIIRGKYLLNNTKKRK